MEINSINNYYSDHSFPKLKCGMDYHSIENGKTMEKSSKNVNRGYYGGSFTGNGAAAYKLGGLNDKIYSSKLFENTLDFFSNKSAVALSFVSLIVAGVLRPITNLSMSNAKDRVDSIYAAAHAIASAVIGFVVSSIVMKPFDDAYKTLKADPKKYLEGLEKLFNVESIGNRRLAKSGPYKILTKIAQMGIDTVALGIPKAMLTIALIPTILKYVFHLEKGKKEDAKVNQANVQPQAAANKTQMTKRPTLKSLLEGNK